MDIKKLKVSMSLFDQKEVIADIQIEKCGHKLIFVKKKIYKIICYLLEMQYFKKLYSYQNQ